MDSKKYDIWTYYTYNKPTDERFYIKISFGVLIFLGILLMWIASAFEEAELVMLGMLFFFVGFVCLVGSIEAMPKSNGEIIYAYIYSFDTKTSKGMLYILDMWSNEFLTRTGLQAYGRRMSVDSNASSRIIAINNDNRRRIVDIVRRYNLIEKLINEGSFEDIAMPIWRVTGIKETTHSVRVYHSYYSNQKQVDTSFLIRDNIENFDTLTKCLREYVHKKTTCCSWCGCIKIKGKCVVCGDTNGIKVPRRMPYYIKSSCGFLAGIIGVLIIQNVRVDDSFVGAIIFLLIIYAFSYSINILVKMTKCVR